MSRWVRCVLFHQVDMKAAFVFLALVASAAAQNVAIASPKANDEVLSFCACQQPLVALPGQLDCPWCGCGWLASCIECRKAFTFAKVVDVDLTYEQIVRRDAINRGAIIAEHLTAWPLTKLKG